LVGEFLPGVVLAREEGFDAGVVDVEVERAAFVEIGRCQSVILAHPNTDRACVLDFLSVEDT